MRGRMEPPMHRMLKSCSPLGNNPQCWPHAAPCAGHYVSLIKSGTSWLFFDDESVESITESQV